MQLGINYPSNYQQNYEIHDYMDGDGPCPSYLNAPYLPEVYAYPDDYVIHPDVLKVLIPKGSFSRIVQKENERFVWKTHKGQLLWLSEMATSHIFFAFRMVFNNSVPPCFRVGDYKPYSDISTWSVEYREQALRKMGEALAERRDLEKNQRAELNDIVLNTRVILALGI